MIRIFWKMRNKVLASHMLSTLASSSLFQLCTAAITMSHLLFTDLILQGPGTSLQTYSAPHLLPQTHCEEGALHSAVLDPIQPMLYLSECHLYCLHKVLSNKRRQLNILKNICFSNSLPGHF